MTTGLGSRFGKMVSTDAYCAAYDPQAGFEGVCTLARQRRNVEFLQQRRPATVLEVGCGTVMLGAMAREAGIDFVTWVIVEPAPIFADCARQVLGADLRFHLIENYLEASDSSLRRHAPAGFDAVLLSGVLHETLEPESLLEAAVRNLAPGGALLVSVPNALSFHRLLAAEAGLIATPHTLSERDRILGHPRVFNTITLRALIAGFGLQDLIADGYLFKPFTNAQTELLLNSKDGPGLEKLVDGLIRLGQQFPQQAAEICITGTRIHHATQVSSKSQEDHGDPAQR